MKCFRLKLLAVALAMTFSFSGSIAPASAGILYLDDGDGRINYAVNTATATVINSWTNAVSSRTFPIAVDGDIRTTGYQTGETGALYNLSGVYQGTNYVLPSTSDTFSDGTTNGTYNYAVSWANGDVYQFSRNWTNPTFLFSAGVAEGGISYDASNNSLWLSRDRASGISDWSLSGSQLSSFNTPQAGSQDWDLALDPTDNTLWIGTYTTTTLNHYAKNGTYLGSETISGLTHASSFFSGEFNLAASAVVTSTWTGSGSDANWMTGGNWGGTAPSASNARDLLGHDPTDQQQ